MVELTGNGYGPRRQPGRAHENVEESRQTGGDFPPELG
jgi:hypothetical protein